MKQEEAQEMHVLLFTFVGVFHEKFLTVFRQHHESLLQLKKNHAKAVGILYHNEGLTSTELGRMLDLEKGGLTTIIDQLETAGLVKRCPDAADRRKILLALTPMGRNAMEQVLEQYSNSLVEMLKDVDDQEIDRFMNNLRYVVDFMINL